MSPRRDSPETAAELHRQLRQLFDAALDRPVTERQPFLEEACAGNLELLDRVSRLVSQHGSAQSFLAEKPHRVEQIGRYVVTGELGRGSMGVVYDAIDPLIGRSVAVKVIHLQALAEQPELSLMQEGLFREARAAGKLFHPGIVTILDMGQAGETAFVTMERVEGPSLQEMLAKGDRIETAKALSILSQTASALDYAHRRGVAHRDVKPGNILLDKGETVKITDFGIAKITSSMVKTLNGLVVGTPSYMSPEQFGAQPTDGRSDQFSLAVVAFELLTSRRPFQGDSISALAHAIVNGERPSAHAANTGLPAAIDQVFDRAMAKLPSQRYGTCAEFVSDLDRNLFGLAPEVETPKSIPQEPESPAPPVGPRRRLRYSAISLTAVVLALAVMWFAHSPAAPTPLPKVQIPQVPLTEGVSRPVVSRFTANPASITVGDSTRLEWESENATKVVIAPDVGDVSGLSEAEAKPVKSRLYSLTATGPGGTVEARVFVTVTSTFSLSHRLLKDAQDKEKAGRLEEALALFRQSAQLGESRAMEALGEMLLEGNGTAKNDAEAARWFRKAADHNELTAMLHLGYMYRLGMGMPVSYASAIYWFSKAADAGNPSAMYDLGLMYQNGEGGPVDPPKALQWFRKAAASGNEEARKRLARLQNSDKAP